MKFELRPDQIFALVEALEYLLARHKDSLTTRPMQPIDTFAHKSSYRQLEEILTAIREAA